MGLSEKDYKLKPKQRQNISSQKKNLKASIFKQTYVSYKESSVAPNFSSCKSRPNDGDQLSVTTSDSDSTAEDDNDEVGKDDTDEYGKDEILQSMQT